MLESNVVELHPAERSPMQRRADLEAERAVLGACFLRDDAPSIAASLLVPADFHSPAHACVFAAITALEGRDLALDVAAVAGELRTMGKLEVIGGMQYLGELTDYVGTAAHLEQHCATVEGLATMRRIADAAHEIETRACDARSRPENLVDFATHRMFSATDRRVDTSAIFLADAVQTSVKAFEMRANEAQAGGVPTRFRDLARMLGGGEFRPGRSYIIAGRPGSGKTSLVVDLLVWAAMSNCPSLFFSSEMNRQEIGDRILCSDAKVDTRAFESLKVEQQDWDRVIVSASRMFPLPLLIDDDKELTLAKLRAKARNAVRTKGVRFIALDYLQLVRVPGLVSREQEVAAVSRGVKKLAGELGVPIISVASMNRGVEQRPDKKGKGGVKEGARPQLSDLRESGSIESDADLVAFVHREELTNPSTDAKGIAEVIIRKQRSGPTGTVKLRFFRQFTRFEDLERDDTRYESDAEDES